MAKARAIVKRLKAVKNIRKITRTMELIATARFKKAMDRAAEAAAYTRKISELVADLSQANLEFHHPLLEKHETEKNSVLLVLTSNRGLCGGYNTGVLKLALKRYQELQSEGQNVRLEVSGKRGISFLKFQGVTADNSYTHFEDRPTFEEVDDLASRYITEYIEGKIDRLDVAYTEFISSSRQAAVVHSLLPIGALETSETDSDEQYDYEFLPSAQEIL
ncbi:MAG: F0F1 ATP synthase subunit gamma, partial [Gimesia chilikensis]